MRIVHQDGLPVRTLSVAQECLHNARADYEALVKKAEVVVAEWARREAQALKRLDDAQKIFERACSSEMAEAPLKSGWGRKQNPTVAIFDEIFAKGAA